MISQSWPGINKEYAHGGDCWWDIAVRRRGQTQRGEPLYLAFEADEIVALVAFGLSVFMNGLAVIFNGNVFQPSYIFNHIGKL